MILTRVSLTRKNRWTLATHWITVVEVFHVKVSKFFLDAVFCGQRGVSFFNTAQLDQMRCNLATW